MELIPIRRDFPQHPRALTVNSDFSLLIAQEGHWYDNAPQVSEVKKPSKTDIFFKKLNKLKQKCFNR